MWLRRPVKTSTQQKRSQTDWRTCKWRLRTGGRKDGGDGGKTPTWEKTAASWGSEKHRSDKRLSLQLWMSSRSSRGHVPRLTCEDSSTRERQNTRAGEVGKDGSSTCGLSASSVTHV